MLGFILVGVLLVGGALGVVMVSRAIDWWIVKTLNTAFPPVVRQK
jgi:hypothetical protein